MKRIKQAVSTAEDLVVGTWEVASLALAVQEGIYHGTFAPEHYEGAMSALVLRAEQVRDQTNAAIEGLYKAIREGGQGG